MFYVVFYVFYEDKEWMLYVVLYVFYGVFFLE
jgi:hypothetical protein